MNGPAKLDLQPLKPEDIPDPSTPAFQGFLSRHFDAGQSIARSMDSWAKHSTKVDGSVQIVTLSSASSMSQIRKELGIKEHWCGRISHHTTESVNALVDPKQDTGLISNLTRKLSRRGSQQINGSENHDAVSATANTRPNGLYERFGRGLLEYHSENEREYIESCRETECLQVFEPHVAEVWRLTYVTPPPTSPRTFVVLLLSKELETKAGKRSFMNISIPFAHPSCPEKQGAEKSRVRGKYVSVERVTEKEGGGEVEWRMATSSDAGGNIPRFVTNASLPSSISEDVPSFLKWMVQRFPA